MWRFIDGKPGHESQTEGLVKALGLRVPVDAYQVDTRQIKRFFFQWMLGCFPLGRELPRPNLIIGAGHRTHWAMLAARRAYGGRAVVLMRPSLPLRCFDCVVIPDHDRSPKVSNVIITKGVLNAIRPSGHTSLNKGLILIGGPSKHHDWDEESITRQLEHLLIQSPEVDWGLTTSRRTPATTVQLVRDLERERLRVVPFEETQPGWVAARLQSCGRVWVTEDSVSMIFESLTAGARVGLLAVPARYVTSRVQRAVEQLKKEGRVESVGRSTYSGAEYLPLAEADRVADVLLKRYILD